MSSTTAPLPLPVIPPQVLAFAQEEGAAAYLPAVVAMTRRVFPVAPMAVFIGDDPEIANDRHIVLEVRLPADSTVETLLPAQKQWTRELFEHCPSTHVCVFRLAMEPDA